MFLSITCSKKCVIVCFFVLCLARTLHCSDCCFYSCGTRFPLYEIDQNTLLFDSRACRLFRYARLVCERDAVSSVNITCRVWHKHRTCSTMVPLVSKSLVLCVGCLTATPVWCWSRILLWYWLNWRPLGAVTEMTSRKVWLVLSVVLLQRTHGCTYVKTSNIDICPLCTRHREIWTHNANLFLHGFPFFSLTVLCRVFCRARIVRQNAEFVLLGDVVRH